jgi:hypothetical protein
VSIPVSKNSRSQSATILNSYCKANALMSTLQQSRRPTVARASGRSTGDGQEFRLLRLLTVQIPELTKLGFQSNLSVRTSSV